jgi:hypothetical protein
VPAQKEFSHHFLGRPTSVRPTGLYVKILCVVVLWLHLQNICVFFFLLFLGLFLRLKNLQLAYYFSISRTWQKKKKEYFEQQCTRKLIFAVRVFLKSYIYTSGTRTVFIERLPKLDKILVLFLSWSCFLMPLVSKFEYGIEYRSQMTCNKS